MNKKIFVFAGTTEGRNLFFKAVAMGNQTTAFVATKDGKSAITDHAPEGFVFYETSIRVGRLSSDMIVEVLEKECPDIVFDATHPFAKEASKNISFACEKCNVSYIRVLRDSQKTEYLFANYVEDMNEALNLIQTNYVNKNILFTTGSKEAVRISEKFDPGYVVKHFFFRILPGYENEKHIVEIGGDRDHVVTGVGPFGVGENISIIKNFDIDVLVTKESGRAGGFEDKILACERTGTEVIVIKRPVESGVSFEEACEILKTL